MNRLIASLLLVLMSVTPHAARAQQIPAALTVEQVRDQFERLGFDTDEPIYWDSTSRTTFFVNDGDIEPRVVLVMVYRDEEAAVQERLAAHTVEETELQTALQWDDDRGPQLIPGYGRSAWLRNVVMVQALRPALGAAHEMSEIVRTDASRRRELATLPTVDADFVEMLRTFASHVALGADALPRPNAT